MYIILYYIKLLQFGIEFLKKKDKFKEKNLKTSGVDFIINIFITDIIRSQNGFNWRMDPFWDLMTMSEFVSLTDGVLFLKVRLLSKKKTRQGI